MLQKMKGTYDIIEDMIYYQTIEKKIMTVSKLFGFKEMRTPHFEASELFHRSVGETTDIISKETYDFIDRGKRSNTLRPEGTAGIVRAYIENKLYAERVTPQRYFYYGSMFRYERPQKGRFREFRQFGAEAFGSADPRMDAEIIAYAVTFLKALKIKDVTIHLNSLGDKTSKTNYHNALIDHLKPDIGSFCKDCQSRYETNPLRILDCKVDQDHPALKSAPRPIDYLEKDDKAHFKRVCDLLDVMQLNYQVDPSLVRGLDYYTHTVFEIKVSEALLGSQNAICGGGRYNHLVESLEGPPTPAVGFSFGIERLIVAMKAAGIELSDVGLHCYLLTLGEPAQNLAVGLMQRLRLGGLTCTSDFLDKSMKAQFKQSDYLNARFVLIIGEDEVKHNRINIKDQETKEEITVSLERCYDILIERLMKPSNCDDCDYKQPVEKSSE